MRIERLTNERYYEDFARWDNDETMNFYHRPRFSETPLPIVTADELQLAAERWSERHTYVALDGERAIGMCTIIADFPHLMTQNERVAWISIVIGERDYWGKGIAQQMMAFLEAEARRQQFTVIELGVFAFNERAQRLYRKLGYEEIGQYPNFVYYNGQFHHDIRMIKRLS